MQPLPPDHEFRSLISKRLEKQDRRWNAEKPSATLDPLISTRLTTLPTNHRSANF